MFTLVLLDGILDGFLKFLLFVLENCVLIWDFAVLFENYSMRWLSIRRNDFTACWAYEETISLYTKSTQNEFSHMLSQNFDSFYMTIQTHAKPTQKRFHHWPSICGNNVMACWAFAETISSLAEHTRKQFHRWLSIRGNDFITCWANGELHNGQSISSMEGETRLWTGLALKIHPKKPTQKTQKNPPKKNH
jgi:hypothetical protein